MEQVQRDHALLRARILRLGGRRAIARLEAGLVAARAAAEGDQQETRSASGKAAAFEVLATLCGHL